MKKPLFLTKFLAATFLLVVFAWQHKLAQADSASDQRVLQLRQQIAELEKKSAEYKKIVTTSQAQEASLKRDLNILSNQISDLQIQVQLTGKQIDSTKLNIDELRSQISQHERVMGDKRVVVANLIGVINEHDQENTAALLLKNNSLSDFFGELETAKSLNRDLLAGITVLKTEKEELDKNKNELEGKKQQLESLNKEQKTKQATLNNTKYSKDDLLQKTKGREETYQKMLSGVEADQNQFFEELKKLEDSAIANHEVILHLTANSLPPKGTILFNYPHSRYSITQGYGYTSYAKKGAYHGNPHNGIDIVGGCGSPIYSLGDGEILVSGTNGGYGNWVAIRLQYNLVSIFAHMRAPSGLANGTHVTHNDVVGYEGTTGNSTGCHVHTGLYRDFFTYPSAKTGELYFNYFEGTVNPFDYLPKP